MSATRLLRSGKHGSYLINIIVFTWRGRRRQGHVEVAVFGQGGGMSWSCGWLYSLRNICFLSCLIVILCPYLAPLEDIRKEKVRRWEATQHPGLYTGQQKEWKLEWDQW